MTVTIPQLQIYRLNTKEKRYQLRHLDFCIYRGVGRGHPSRAAGG